MGTDSDPRFSPPTPTSAPTVADVTAAGTDAWRMVEARWPRRRWTTIDYVQVTTLLDTYFQQAFPRRGSVRPRWIVASAVEEFVADWHRQAATRTRQGDHSAFPDPRQVRDAVRDSILEHGGASSAAAAPDAARVTPIGPSMTADISLTKVAVRAHPDAVRAGLRELFAEGSRDDFWVISAYLDLADPDLGRPPPTSTVVARLRGYVAEWPARQAIRSFQARVKRIEQRRIEQRNDP